MRDIKFDFDDILLMPSLKSDIISRYDDIEIAYSDNSYDNMLPLIAAPMDTVINEENCEIFCKNNISVALPRTISLPSQRMIHYSSVTPSFVSFGMELKSLLLWDNDFQLPELILIDVANGHMENVMELAKMCKERKPNCKIMVGNIANPETYRWYAESGVVDYVRLGIGNGAGCWISGTKIQTKNGLIDVKDICTDDEVLTADKTYRKVIAKISYNCSDELISINDEICTSNHEILVANKTDVGLINDDNYMDFCYYVHAKDINPLNHLVVGFE